MERRHRDAVLVAVVAVVLAGLTGVAIWQATSAHRELDSLRSEVETLESRLLTGNTDADKAAAEAERTLRLPSRRRRRLTGVSPLRFARSAGK
jgi:hypothetical protein